MCFFRYLPRCAWTSGTLWAYLRRAAWPGTADRSERATSFWWSVVGDSNPDQSFQKQTAAPSAVTQPSSLLGRRWVEPKPVGRACLSTWQPFLSTLRSLTSQLSWGWCLIMYCQVIYRCSSPTFMEWLCTGQGPTWRSTTSQRRVLPSYRQEQPCSVLFMKLQECKRAETPGGWRLNAEKQIQTYFINGGSQYNTLCWSCWLHQLLQQEHPVMWEMLSQVTNFLFLLISNETLVMYTLYRNNYYTLGTTVLLYSIYWAWVIEVLVKMLKHLLIIIYAHVYSLFIHNIRSCCVLSFI